MDIISYQEETKKTLPDLGHQFTNELHMVIGAATEAGELLDSYKKVLAYGKQLDKVNVVEEIGDSFWYLVNLCSLLGVSIEEVLDKNIAKLRLRFPSGFTQEKALVRDLDKEREVLESEQ